MNPQDLSPTDFELLCKLLLEKSGFEVETTKASGDGGIDLIATKKEVFTSGKYIVQCKRYSGSVGEPVLRDLYGVVTAESASKGILMTTGTFTVAARSFAVNKPLELIDGEILNQLISQHLSGEDITFQYQEKKSGFTPLFVDDYFCTAEQKLSDFKLLSKLVSEEPENPAYLLKLITLYQEASRGDFFDTMSTYNLQGGELLLNRLSLHLSYGEILGHFSKMKTLKGHYLLFLAESKLLQGDLLEACKLYKETFNLREFLEKADEEPEIACKLMQNIALIYKLAGYPQKGLDYKRSNSKYINAEESYLSSIYKNHRDPEIQENYNTNVSTYCTFEITDRLYFINAALSYRQNEKCKLEFDFGIAKEVGWAFGLSFYELSLPVDENGEQGEMLYEISSFDPDLINIVPYKMRLEQMVDAFRFL